MSTDLPSGTITFLFTDIEGSTRLWDRHGGDMRTALARHDAILRRAITDHDGMVFKHTGDGLAAVFTSAGGAVRAAVQGQDDLARQDWTPIDDIRVRIGVHTGEAVVENGDYHAPAVNLAARVEAAATGGQIIVSDATLLLSADELGPGIRTLELGDHELPGISRAASLHQILHPSVDSSAPPLRAGRRIDKGNLPQRANPLIGREEDLAALTPLLLPGSVVTLIGVGGVGKTSLALEAAGGAASRFDGGAWLVELAGVSDPGGVVDAVRAAIGFSGETVGNAQAHLVDGLLSNPRLLVLDNCEHLIAAVSSLVVDIERFCPQVAVLATSREPLATAGERAWPVRSLEVPTDDDDAGRTSSVRLFIERAQATGAELDDAPAAMAAIADICRRLDGIPLAIELAAARSRTMGLIDLGEHLDERFRLLTGGRRGAVERHQTLQAAVDWSYRLLDPDAQQLFDHVSVFVDEFTRPDVEAVAGGVGIESFDVLDLMTELVDKSMIQLSTDGDVVRFSLLETLRQYGEQRLEDRGNSDSARRAHAEWVISVNEQLGGRHNAGPSSKRATWRSMAGDLRSAHAWAVAIGDDDMAIRLTASTAAFARTDTIVDVSGLGEATLALGIDREHPLAASVYGLAASLAMNQGNRERALDLAQQGLACNPADQQGRHWCYTNAVLETAGTGDLHGARSLGEEWRSWAAEPRVGPGDIAAGLPLSFLMTGLIERYAEEDRATELIDRGFEHALSTTDPEIRAFAHFARGELLSISAPDVALTHYREAADLGRDSGTITEHLAVAGEAAVLGRVGTPTEAFERFQEVLLYWREHGLPFFVDVVHRNLVALLIRLQHDEEAAILHGYLEGTTTKATPEQTAGITQLGRRLGADMLSSAMDRGATLTRTGASDVAIDIVGRLRA